MARNAPTNDPRREDAAQARSEPQKGAGSSILLITGGLALLMAGAALIALPMAAKPYSWIATGAEKHGVTGMPLVLAGIGLFGLWIASRSRRDTRELPIDQPDQGLLLEQLASDLAQMRGGMQDLRVEFVYLKDQVLKLPSQLPAAQDMSGENPQAAVYGLAASVDQLSARMEHLMRAQEASLHGRIGSLEQSVRAAQMQLASMQQRLESATAQSWPGEHSEESADATHSEYDLASEPQIEIEEGYRASPHDVNVLVELEEESLAMDLGLLDRLDDSGTPHNPKTSPAITPSIAGKSRTIDIFEDASARADLNVKAPLPSSPNSVASPASNGRTIPIASDIDAKMDILRELMSDPRVRDALAGQRRSIGG